MPSYVRILRTHACGTYVDKRMRSKQGILRMANGRSVERRPHLGTEGSVGEACAVEKGFESCGEVGCLYFGWHCARLHASNANVQGDDDVRQGIVGERASERAGHHHRLEKGCWSGFLFFSFCGGANKRARTRHVGTLVSLHASAYGRALLLSSSSLSVSFSCLVLPGTHVGGKLFVFPGGVRSIHSGTANKVVLRMCCEEVQVSFFYFGIPLVHALARVVRTE